MLRDASAKQDSFQAPPRSPQWPSGAANEGTAQRHLAPAFQAQQERHEVWMCFRSGWFTYATIKQSECIMYCICEWNKQIKCNYKNDLRVAMLYFGMITIIRAMRRSMIDNSMMLPKQRLHHKVFNWFLGLVWYWQRSPVLVGIQVWDPNSYLKDALRREANRGGVR